MTNVNDDIDADLDHMFDATIDSTLAINATHAGGDVAGVFYADNTDRRAYFITKTASVTGWNKGDPLTVAGASYWIEAMPQNGYGVTEVLLRDA